MLDVIKPITNENTFKHIEPIKQTNNILIYIKYEYLSRYGDPAEELYDLKLSENTTIKQVKDELNKSFIFGELDPDQYEIYKGGEQEDKERTNREPQTYYYIYLEPQLIDDDNKTIKECNITGGELLHLKIKLKLLLHIPRCRFNTLYFYTYNTIEDIQKEAIQIYNKKYNDNLKITQITIYYGYKQLDPDEQISTYNIYNLTTLTTEINYGYNIT
jgi:hypothetical protein